MKKMTGLFWGSFSGKNPVSARDSRSQAGRLRLSALIPVFVFAALCPLAAQEQSYPPQIVLIAAYKGDVALLREILKTNPDKDLRDSRGATALHDAMFQTNMEVVDLLISHGYDVNDVSPVDGNTPLHNAVWANNTGAVKILLGKGADKNIKNKQGQTPLALARKLGKPQMVNLLFDPPPR
jgi:ankyrin repeat protein